MEETMIDVEMRRMVFRLKGKGRGTRAIAGALGISRTSVKTILQAAAPECPASTRERWLDEHLELIRKLYVECDRSVTRVAEKLEELLETAVPYSTLTAFCRHHGMGAARRAAAGGSLPDRPRGRDAARHLTDRSDGGRSLPPVQRPFAQARVLEDPVPPVLPAVHAIPVQGLPDAGVRVHPGNP
jgi:hypothetical protein